MVKAKRNILWKMSKMGASKRDDKIMVVGKGFRHLMLVSVFTILTVISLPIHAESANKESKVTYELENGILTIKGKGEMPENMTFKNTKEIEKVVIKKGVTSISTNAFLNCKNLQEVKISDTVKTIGENSFEGTGIKEIVIPKSVKKIGIEALYNCDKLTTVSMPGKFTLMGDVNEERYPEIMNGESITTVKFNSNLSLDTLIYCEGTNWNVSKNDPNYTTIGGAIYSKDGKTLVRVPSDITEFTVADRCETFSLQSVLYGQYLPDDGIYSCCSKLEKITISESVKHIEDTKYMGEYSSANMQSIKEIIVNSKKIDSDSIGTLISNMKEIFAESNKELTNEDVVKMFPDRVTVADGFYILDNTVLIGYEGKKSEVSVPIGIKVIADSAFSQEANIAERSIKKVILPEGVEKIGDKAFYYCTYLEEINIPDTIKEIGNNAFAGTKVKKIEFPDSDIKWGEYVFAHTELKKVILPDGMAVIPKGMFAYSIVEKINVPESLRKISQEAFIGTNVDAQAFLNNANLKIIGENAFTGTVESKLVIPAHIEKIGKNAFDKMLGEKRNIIIQGNAKGYKKNAFSGMYTERLNDTLKFESGIKNAFTDVKIHYVSHKNNKTEISIDWLKVKGVDGYDIRISTTKNFKKNLKKITVRKKTEKIITINKKLMNVYVEIRPYKVVNGNKVYGRWSRDMMSMYE